MENDLIRRGDALSVVADNNRTDHMSLDCYDRLIAGLAQIPAVDAVEVVRCRECNYHTEDGFCRGRGWPMSLTPDDDYCSRGQRRKDGDGHG